MAALLAASVGCGKSKSTSQAGRGSSAAGTGGGTTASGPADPRSKAIVDRSKELRDRACACTEPMCAATVRKDHDLWLHDQIAEIGKLGEPRSTTAEQDEASGYQRELFACLAKYGADKTAPAPIPRTSAPSDSTAPTPTAPTTP